MIDDKHGHRIKAMLEQHGVAVRSELYGRTTAFRLVLLSAETSLTAAPAAADAASTSAASTSAAAAAATSATTVATVAQLADGKGVLRRDRTLTETARDRREILSELIRREGALPAVVTRASPNPNRNPNRNPNPNPNPNLNPSPNPNPNPNPNPHLTR